MDEDELLQALLGGDMAMEQQVPAPAASADPQAMQAILALAQEGGGTPAEPEMAEPEPWVPAGEMTGMDAQYAAPQAPPGGMQMDPLEAMAPKPHIAPNQAADYVMGEQPGTHAYGVQDTRFDPMAAAARVRELYAQPPQLAPGQPSGPGQYEQEFLSRHPAPQQAPKWASFMSAIGGGNPMEAAKMFMAQQQQYDQGLMQARELDRKRGRRIDQGTAEFLALSGISPEAAVNVTEDSPLIMLLKAGGLHLGKSYRGQDTQMLRTDVGEVGDTYRQRVGEIGKNQRAQLSADTQLEAARIRKRGGGGAGDGSSPDMLSAFLQRQVNVKPDVADAFVAGTLDPSQVSPETLAVLNSTATIYQGLGPKKRAELSKGLLAREGGETDRPDVAAATKRADPKARVEQKERITSVGQPLFAGIKGWNSLSPKAKQAFVGIGLGGENSSMDKFMSQVKVARLTPEEQAAVTSLYRLLNSYVSKLSGAAVSGGEWKRMAGALGVTGEGVSPFQGTEALGRFLQDSMREYKTTRKNILSEYPDLFDEGK